MQSNSLWQQILCARTTSQAIELAADIPLPALNDAPLPLRYEDLSFHAQENARAVRRALGVRVQGLEKTGWELWEETEEDRAFFGEVDEKDTQGARTDDMDGVRIEVEEMESDLGEEESNNSDEEVHVSGKKKGKKDDGATALLKKSGTRERKAKAPLPEAAKSPSVDEISAAEALKSWAISSSHATPPAKAVDIISRSGAVPALLKIVVAKDVLPDLLAPVMTVFTENVGSGFANTLMNTLVIPYAEALKAPAPRDIMQALVSFSERHWRVGVVFYEFFSAQGTPVNGAVAEIMVRIAAVLTLDGAMQGLRAWCNATWGEDGIRIVEALLGRCKTETGVVGLVVPALERNVIGSEKSVRFGKLLFTIVRDLPAIAEDYDTAMESICSRSTVFLAKRALTMLRGKRLNT